LKKSSVGSKRRRSTEMRREEEWRSRRGNGLSKNDGGRKRKKCEREKMQISLQPHSGVRFHLRSREFPAVGYYVDRRSPSIKGSKH
jgi:hypothetical protein